MVPEGLTNEELLELEQKYKTNCRRRKRRTPRKFTVKDLAEAFLTSKKSLKKFEVNGPQNTEKFSLIERNVHGALPAYKQIYDEKRNKSSKPHIRTYFYKE